jgi:hypothetical protein
MIEIREKDDANSDRLLVGWAIVHLFSVSDVFQLFGLFHSSHYQFLLFQANVLADN